MKRIFNRDKIRIRFVTDLSLLFLNALPKAPLGFFVLCWYYFSSNNDAEYSGDNFHQQIRLRLDRFGINCWHGQEARILITVTLFCGKLSINVEIPRFALRWARLAFAEVGVCKTRFRISHETLSSDWTTAVTFSGCKTNSFFSVGLGLGKNSSKRN